MRTALLVAAILLTTLAISAPALAKACSATVCIVKSTSSPCWAGGSALAATGYSCIVCHRSADGSNNVFEIPGPLLLGPNHNGGDCESYLIHGCNGATGICTPW